MVYLLTPLGRGGRGGSFGHDGVGNGGLWWLEWASEQGRFTLQLPLLLLPPSPEKMVEMLA